MAYRYTFKKRKRCMVNFCLGMAKNALSQSDCKILKSAISQVKIVNQLDLWHTDVHSRNVKHAW